MKANAGAAKILKAHFLKKKKGRSGFSVRVFARELEVSPAFASGLLNGQKAIPASRLSAIAQILEMDEFALGKLRTLLGNEVPSSPRPAKAEVTYTEIPRQRFSILKPWFNVAILDLITCADFRDDPHWIAARLGVSPAQARFALSELESKGFIERIEHGWQRADTRARLASDVSRAEIRDFHAQMMDKAKEVLRTQTSLEDFALREISGLSIAANPAQLERAKQRLREAIHEVAEILTEGECTEVYHLGVQLFPLTRKS